MATSERDPRSGSVEALRERARTFDVGESVAIGAGAMIATYVLTLLLVVLTADAIDLGAGPLLTYVGFLTYSAHHVPAVGESVSIMALDQASISTAKFAAYSAIPMVVSLCAGGVATLRSGRRDGAPEDALFAALSVAAGYATVSTFGSLLVTSTTTGGTAVSVDTVQAALYGLAYPLGFGLLAAAILQFARYLTVRVDTDGEPRESSE
ncbi:hypothetical protein [Halococcoides cellulosivorans]|nr:hypothetical protein [Halococcoides cellulosivorans]